MDGFLKLVADVGEEFFPITKKGAYRRFNSPKYFDLEDYFPSEIERIVGRLERKGWVEKQVTEDGIKVIITDKGKKQVLFFNLDRMEKKEGKWDKKWRVVFFDVEERDRRHRDALRKYLTRLGFKQMQKSVWVSPYDCVQEIEYLREILEVPHSVKWGVLEKMENDEDLRRWFDLR